MSSCVADSVLANRAETDLVECRVHMEGLSFFSTVTSGKEMGGEPKVKADFLLNRVPVTGQFFVFCFF